MGYLWTRHECVSGKGGVSWLIRLLIQILQREIF
jgi:hypothetical protein